MKSIFLIILAFTSPLMGSSFGISFEVFSMPMSEAAALRRAKVGGAETYRRVVSQLEGTVVKQEAFLSLRVEDGSKAVVEEIEEMIHPTEYEHPGGLSSSHPVPGWEPRLFPLRWVASAYDTKNVGKTLEVALQAQKRGVELRLNLTEVTFLARDHYGEGVGKMAMPRFAAQKIKSRVIVPIGKPVLVGSISPPRELQEGGEKRVWLAFVTVSKETK